jgi:DNA-binding transcriptional regulator YhcF (GntR family)
MTLDPDDSRPPYLQVAGLLKAAILTREFAPGAQLPSGAEMAETYGVSRQTIQSALKELKKWNLTVSRAGSGTYVRANTERPVGLRPHVEKAFEARHVTIDFAGYSGETLANALQEPIDKIRAGRLTPETVNLRILIQNPDTKWAVPCLIKDQADSPEFRQRAATITQRGLHAVCDSLNRLDELGLVSANVITRSHNAAALFKVYILNDIDSFFGFYPIAKRRVNIAEEELQMWDFSGKDTVLFHHSAEDTGSVGDLYLQQAKTWFDSIWNTIARDYAL